MPAASCMSRWVPTCDALQTVSICLSWQRVQRAAGQHAVTYQTGVPANPSSASASAERASSPVYRHSVGDSRLNLATALHVTALTAQDKQLAGVESDDVAGFLQKKLARFLRRCPDGIVLIDGGAIVPREPAVMPLITALSEQSVFVYNGRDIPVGSALLIMTVRTDLPQMEPISGTLDEDKASSSVKGRLVAWLVGSGRPRGEDPKVVNALALRRRFDVVAYWKQ